MKRLTDEHVRKIRTSALTDSIWARRLGATASAIRNARIGLTHRDHPTPPDLAPRIGGGRYHGKARRLARLTEAEVSI